MGFIWTVGWEGTAALDSKLRMIARNFPKERDIFLRQEAENVKARVKPKTPANTGHLRGKWEVSEPAGGAIEVFNNVEYAGYVEYGHRIVAFGKDTGRVQPGVYMLRDALDESREQFVADASLILARLFR